jgi:hypothetical protein
VKVRAGGRAGCSSGVGWGRGWRGEGGKRESVSPKYTRARTDAHAHTNLSLSNTLCILGRPRFTSKRHGCFGAEISERRSTLTKRNASDNALRMRWMHKPVYHLLRSNTVLSDPPASNHHLRPLKPPPPNTRGGRRPTPLPPCLRFPPYSPLHRRGGTHQAALT